MICDIRVGGGGGAWHADDLIVFAADATGPLYRVTLSVGTPAPVTPAPRIEQPVALLARLSAWNGPVSLFRQQV